MPSSIAKEGKLLAKHSMVYGLGTILNRVVGFIMIPIYTRFLTPADYGILELLGLTTELIGMVISVGLASAMYRYYFEYEDEETRKKVISTAILSFGTIAFLCLSLVSFSTGFLAEQILDSRDFSSYFLISFTSLWFNTIVGMGHTFLQIKKKSTLFLITSLLKLLCSLGLNIYFVVFKHYGVLGILISTLLASIFGTLMIVIPILFHVGIRFSFSLFKQMFRFGLPIIPSNLGAFLVHVSDRFFLKYFRNLGDTGIYSLGYKFGNLPNTFVTSPFMQIWQARRFELFKEPNAEELFGRIFTYFCFLITFVGLGISVATKEVLEIVSKPAFWDAYKIVPIIVLSYIFFSFHYHFNMGILIQKKTRYLAYINGSNGVLNLLFNFFFIRKWGVYGAAFATLASFLYKITLTYILSSRIFKIHFEFSRITRIFLGAGVIYLLALGIGMESVYLRLAVKTLLVGTYPLLLWIINVPSEGEKEKMRSFVKNRLASLRG